MIVSRLVWILSSWRSSVPMVARWVEIWPRRWSIAASLPRTSSSAWPTGSLAGSALMADKTTAVQTATVGGAQSVSRYSRIEYSAGN